MTPTVLAIFGPTGVGKTALAVALADALRSVGDDPVAVSVDALQVYRGLETLTGVASPDQRARLEHRLVSYLPVTATSSVAEHAALAHAEIDALLAERRTPIVVGGTGLYLRAALADLELRPPPPPGVREALDRRLREEGGAVLHAELAAVAPWAAREITIGDGRRTVRALELHAVGALRPRSEPSELWTSHTRHPTRLIGCVRPREELYARIDARVRGMVAAGAADEVRAADAAGASATARVALGFRELLDDDVARMAQRTRQYARRQGTWLRKLPGVEIVDLSTASVEALAAELLA